MGAKKYELRKQKTAREAKFHKNGKFDFLTACQYLNQIS